MAEKNGFLGIAWILNEAERRKMQDAKLYKRSLGRKEPWKVKVDVSGSISLMLTARVYANLDDKQS